jgi:YVTN family beta-propeller protein
MVPSPEGLNTKILSGGSTMFRMSFARLAVLLMLVVAVPAMASRYAYIPRSGNNVVSVVDTQTNTIVANINVSGGPWGVATHPAGHRVYVPGPGSNTVAVIDTATNTVIANVPVGAGPYHAAVSPDGTEVYVPNYGGTTVSVISAATNTVIASIGGMAQPNAVAFSPSGQFAYVTSYSSGALYVINTTTRTVTTVPGMATQSEGIAVHPSGRYVYTVGVNASTVRILDTTNNTIANSVNIGGSYGVAVHPNGRYFYVSRGTDQFRVFRTSDNVQVAELDVGTGTRSPTGISLTPSGNFAYVANRGSSASVSVVNTVTNAVVTTIGLGNAPYALGTAIQRPLFGHGSIASGQYHSCRVRADQTVDCWGRDDFGQAVAPAGTFTQVVAGSAHSCGLRTDGSVSCWGNNVFGQATPAAGNNFQLLASGARHVCGLRTDNSVVCWGQNDQGQATPTGASNFQGIAAGSSHTCGLRSTGDISCWGRSDESQLAAPAGPFIQVVAGSAFSCGLRQDGEVSCWGDATGGKTTPPAGQFAELSAQANFACGLRIGGGAECWGADNFTETLVPNPDHAAIAAGRSHTCALKPLGVAECWGWNLYNQAPQFGLDPLALTNATVGLAYVGGNPVTMTVVNAGTRFPYVPRNPAFAVVDGSLPNGLTLSAGGVITGTPSAAGTFNFTVQGEDANGFTAERDYSIVVSALDGTPPVVAAQVTGLAGNNGWYRGNVVVSWTVSDAESQITNTTGCGPVVISMETVGTDVTCQATSAGGTTTETVTIKLDKTAPTGVPTVSNRRPLFNEVITLTANGTDAVSGVASEVCDEPLTDTVSMDQQRKFCTITDEAGNVAVRPVSYRVIYGFSGFTDTVLNPGWWNSASLNQAITFKFRVFDANNVGVTDLTAASFSSTTLNCPAVVKNVIPVAASAPGLVHVGDGNYEFTWTAPSSPDCARLVLELGDGDHVRRAQIRFQ